MARQPGRKAEQAHGPLEQAGQVLGFLLLTGISLAILVGVVLVPPYARMLRTEHRRDVTRMKRDFEAAQVRLRTRYLAEAPRDPVETGRLACNMFGYRPSRQIVQIRPPDGATPPGAIWMPSPELPPAPRNWATKLDARLQKASTRRGLLMLAALGLIAAAVLFVVPDKQRTPTTA
jgi:hypothetical protein